MAIQEKLNSARSNLLTLGMTSQKCLDIDTERYNRPR